MYKNTHVTAIIAAAGLSSRMKTKVNKQFLNINSKPVLAHTLETFNSCRYIDEVILVTQEIEIDNCRKNIVQKYGYKKVKKIVPGGSSRGESVYNGLKHLSEDSQIIVSHDGARPFVSLEKIEEAIEETFINDAVILGVPVKDTIKVVNDSLVEATPNRDQLWAIQTPQVFKREIIVQAYEKAKDIDFLGTDDSSFVEKIGKEVKVIMGDYNNIKITTQEDMILAENIVNRDMVEQNFLLEEGI